MKGTRVYCDEALCLCEVEDHQVLESNQTASVEEHNIAILPHSQTEGKDTSHVLNSRSTSYIPILE